MSTTYYKENPTMFADEPGRFILAVLLIPFIVGIFWLGWWYLVNKSTVVTVDEDRITWRKGVFNKEYVEIELRTIKSVRVDQTFVDRIFGCGILKVYTAGDNPDITQDGLPDPNRLREVLRNVRSAV